MSTEPAYTPLEQIPQVCSSCFQLGVIIISIPRSMPTCARVSELARPSPSQLARRRSSSSVTSSRTTMIAFNRPCRKTSVVLRSRTPCAFPQVHRYANALTDCHVCPRRLVDSAASSSTRPSATVKSPTTVSPRGRAPKRRLSTSALPRSTRSFERNPRASFSRSPLSTTRYG